MHVSLQLTVTDGKVFFELADDVEEIEKVLQLKIAERAFVQVVLVKTSELGKITRKLTRVSHAGANTQL